MKLAIPTKENKVDNHFGHCEYFTIISVKGKEIVSSEILDPGKTCGCKSNLVSDLKNIGVTTLLAGQIGQGAINKVTNAGIKVIRGCEGDVKSLVNDYLDGKVQDKLIVCPPHEHGHGHECKHN